MAAAAALSLLAIWARAIRWRYLFPPRSDPPGLVAAIMIGYMINNVLPLRAGEFARVYVVAHRWGHGFWTTLGTVVVERVLDGMTVVLMLGILVFLIPVPALMQWGAFVMLAVNLVADRHPCRNSLAPGPHPHRRAQDFSALAAVAGPRDPRL